MRILSRNCKRAKWISPVWDYIKQQKADIVLLQEVWELPQNFGEIFPYIIQRTPVNKSWDTQRFHNVIASKYQFWHEIVLRSSAPRIFYELEHFKNNIFGYEVIIDSKVLNLIAVYSPARPISKERMQQVDTQNIRSRNNPDVYVSDILRYALQEKNLIQWNRFIWWDFNLSVSFDKKTKWWRGNQHSIDRMQALWLQECIVKYNGYTPTFRHSKGWIVDQIDHIFLSKALVDVSISCKVDSQCLIDRISDHAPIIIELDL